LCCNLNILLQEIAAGNEHPITIPWMKWPVTDIASHPPQNMAECCSSVAFPHLKPSRDRDRHAPGTRPCLPEAAAGRKIAALQK
jgi:hypothetical protein